MTELLYRFSLLSLVYSIFYVIADYFYCVEVSIEILTDKISLFQ